MAIRIEAPKSRGDLEAWARIVGAVSGQTFSVDELDHSRRTEPGSLWVLGYFDDEPVGTGLAKPASVAGALFAMVRVLPERRKRGVGSALLAAVAAHARDAGKEGLFGRVREDDDETLRFLRARGFDELSRERPVVLDATTFEAPALSTPAELEKVSLAEQPDLAQAAYDVDLETSYDVPMPVSIEPMGYERWNAMNVTGPGAIPEACLVALIGGEAVGYAGLRRRGPGSSDAENLMTGVRRAWRGRGVATALKVEQILRARSAGVERLYTFNDEPNAAIRGINERLGYQALPVNLIMHAPVSALSRP